MNTKTLLLVASALAVAAGLWLMATAFRPNPNPMSVSVLNYDPPGLMYTLVVLRAGPGRQYERIGFLEPGSSASAISRDEAGGWLLLDAPKGWVAIAAVESDGDIDALPARDVVFPPPHATVVSVLNSLDGTTVDRRMGPGEAFPMLDPLDPGESYVAIAQDPSGQWLLLEPPGWISVADVQVAGNPDELPILHVGD